MRHVIFFDNDFGYEDNRQTAVCIAADGIEAKKEMKRLTEWLDAKQDKFPVIKGGDMEQGAWLEAEDKRRSRINRIRCPYGCTEIREGVQHCQGRFFAVAVPEAGI